jgi:hypothetical protein
LMLHLNCQLQQAPWRNNHNAKTENILTLLETVNMFMGFCKAN